MLTKDGNARLDFERAIQEKCSARKMSEFWNYFQKWKGYFPMEEAERKKYLEWAEKIVSERVDAIVSGQHRNQYGQVAALLAVVGEIKESMGTHGAAREIWARYKGRFPRHSSFQRDEGLFQLCRVDRKREANPVRLLLFSRQYFPEAAFRKIAPGVAAVRLLPALLRN